MNFYLTVPTTPMNISVPKLATAGSLSINSTKPTSQTPLLTIILRELRKITGNALIRFDKNTNLTMPKLDSVLGDVSTEYVKDTTPSYYSALKYVGGSFKLILSEIKDISGLSTLNYIGGKLQINSNSKLKNYCPLRTMLNNGGLKGAYEVSNNAYNPTI